jgi:hypothetical protein
MLSTPSDLQTSHRIVQDEFGEHRLRCKLKTLGEYLFPDKLLNLVS